MTQYADPRRCPDCRGPVTPGDPACAACALPLRGETAGRLFATLTQADELLGVLRTASSAAVAPAVAAGPGPAPFAPTPYPATADSRRPRRGALRAASVPAVLLTLGAGCLLVAAVVFLAVAWSVMGVGGRTATLVALTVVAGGLAWWLGRRGLRAAAESLALVGYGLLALDVAGADHARWLGALSASGLLAVLGAVLGLTGVAGALLVRRRTSLPGLLAGELVAAVGVGLGALALGSSDGLPLDARLVLAVLVGVAGTGVARGLRLRAAATGAGLVAVVAWLALAGYALARTDDHDATWHTLWAGLDAWPLVAAAVLAAGGSLLRGLPAPARVGVAAVAESLLCWAALAPVGHLSVTTMALVAVGVLAVTGLATRLLPRPWSFTGALTQTVAGLAALVAILGLVLAGLARVVDAVEPVWGGRPGDRLPGLDGGDALPAPWLLPLLVLAVAGTVLVLDRAVRSGGLSGGRTIRVDGPALAGVAAASVVAALVLYPVPVWLVLGTLVGCAAGSALPQVRHAVGRRLSLVGAASFLLAAVALSLHAPALTAAVSTAVVGAAAVVHLLARGDRLAATAGGVLATAAAGSVWAWGATLSARPVDSALAGLLLLAVLVLCPPYAPGRWWACTRPVVARAGTEAAAAVAALALGSAGVLLAPAGEALTWTSVYLTLAGVTAAATALLREDRRPAGWAGGLLLAAATWARLWEAGVQVPEAYTLPGALALLVVGTLRLRRHPSEGTVRALRPGLALALAPSLLWALGEPAGLRELLLGAGCLLLVLAGARLGWTAPIAAGAAAGAALVLWLAAPDLGHTVPRWVLIGMAGTVLVAVGATWERRLQEARHLVGYLRTLR
jgi:hypothetical protein